MIALVTRRFGFRRIETRGRQLFLNEQPILLRGVLSWGWDPDHIAPNETIERARAEIRRVKALGFNLVKLSSLGFRVPAGFIITTEVFRCREVIESYPPAQRNFVAQIRHHVTQLERATGRKVGDPANPLLLSVRSGSK